MPLTAAVLLRLQGLHARISNVHFVIDTISHIIELNDNFRFRSARHP